MEFLEAMQQRYACKLYDSRPILPQDVRKILEFGHLTPTSFGLELWSFHVAQSAAVKQDLFAACCNQECVRTSAMTVAVLVRSAAFANPDGELVKERGRRFPDTFETFIEDYRPYYQFLTEHDRLDCWLRSQGYLAVANMMTGAASLGIQSCAIEGFDQKKVLDVFKVEQAQWQVSLLASFGYPLDEVRPKIRLPFEDLVYTY